MTTIHHGTPGQPTYSTVWAELGHDPVAGDFLSIDAIGEAKNRLREKLGQLDVEPYGPPEVREIGKEKVELAWRIRKIGS